ncbi:hypothetical protein BLA28_15745 [Eisenbergiella tayi]|nr:hypothetical protein BLA28_15745 [Eisenbergiella tayi]
MVKGGDKLEQNCISFFTQAHLRYIMIKAVGLPVFIYGKTGRAFVWVFVIKEGGNFMTTDITSA